MDNGDKQQDAGTHRSKRKRSRNKKKTSPNSEHSDTTTTTTGGAAAGESQGKNNGQNVVGTNSGPEHSDSVKVELNSSHPNAINGRTYVPAAIVVNYCLCHHKIENQPGHDSKSVQPNPDRNPKQHRAKNRNGNSNSKSSSSPAVNAIAEQTAQLSIANELNHNGNSTKAKPASTTTRQDGTGTRADQQSARPKTSTSALSGASASARSTQSGSNREIPTKTVKNAPTNSPSQKKDGPHPPTFSQNSPRRQINNSEKINNNTKTTTQLRATKSEENPQTQTTINPLSTPHSSNEPQTSTATASASPSPSSSPSSAAATRQSYPPINLPKGFTKEQAEGMLKKFLPGTRLHRTSPDGPLASATVKVGPDCPPSAASRINQQCREEHANRRHRHERRLSNKVGKSFQLLEESLPEQFLPQQRTRRTILEQTRSFTKMLETQLAAAPATSMCLVCNKPRIACGCPVPEFLRQPVQRVGQRMEDYITKQFEGDDLKKQKFRIRVYEEEDFSSDEEEEEVGGAGRVGGGGGGGGVVGGGEVGGGEKEGEGEKERATAKEEEGEVVEEIEVEKRETKKTNGGASSNGNGNGNGKGKKKRGRK